MNNASAFKNNNRQCFDFEHCLLVFEGLSSVVVGAQSPGPLMKIPTFDTMSFKTVGSAGLSGTMTHSLISTGFYDPNGLLFII